MGRELNLVAGDGGLGSVSVIDGGRMCDLRVGGVGWYLIGMVIGSYVLMVGG